MKDRRASDERLPWLKTVPARATVMPAAARRSRTPLLVLLAMLVASTIAVMAFLAGRTTAAGERRQAAAPLTVRLPAATLAPAAVPVIATAEPAPSAPAAPRASASPAGSVRGAPARRARPDRRGMVPRIERPFPLAPMASATPPVRADAEPIAGAVNTPAPSPATTKPPAARAPRTARMPSISSRSGIVQLGAYVSMPMLDSAWARLVGAHPRLGTMPRLVTGTAQPGRPYYYRLRVATGSRREARALCDHLHRVGRGCMIIGTPR